MAASSSRIELRNIKIDGDLSENHMEQSIDIRGFFDIYAGIWRKIEPGDKGLDGL